MNRQIKLRGWHKVFNLMSSPVTLPQEKLDFIFETPKDRDYPPGKWSMEDIEIMEWTGLYDKNNTPIFEGDIVKTVRPDVYGDDDREPVELAVVVYVAPSFHAKYVNDALNQFVSGKSGFILSPSNEVVGNIYEHAHLLKEEQSI